MDKTTDWCSDQYRISFYQEECFSDLFAIIIHCISFFRETFSFFPLVFYKFVLPYIACSQYGENPGEAKVMAVSKSYPSSKLNRDTSKSLSCFEHNANVWHVLVYNRTNTSNCITFTLAHNGFIKKACFWKQIKKHGYRGLSLRYLSRDVNKTFHGLVFVSIYHTAKQKPKNNLNRHLQRVVYSFIQA